jgi:hypothetical protein
MGDKPSIFFFKKIIGVDNPLNKKNYKPKLASLGLKAYEPWIFHLSYPDEVVGRCDCAKKKCHVYIKKIISGWKM